MGLYKPTDLAFRLPDEFEGCDDVDAIAEAIAEIVEEQEGLEVEECTVKIDSLGQFLCWLVIEADSGYGWDEFYLEEELAEMFAEGNGGPEIVGRSSVERVD